MMLDDIEREYNCWILVEFVITINTLVIFTKGIDNSAYIS